MARFLDAMVLRIYQEEDRALLSQVGPAPQRILDVGCGQGRYLIPLVKLGHDVTGVDASAPQVEQLAAAGFNILLPTFLAELDAKFDVVIMSHIIEHIEPRELISFLDLYLSKLKVGGKLIIATPLPYDGFFDDYDHIRPYTPKAICFLYSDYPQQQAKPKYALQLKHLWIRRWPWVRYALPGFSLPYMAALYAFNALGLLAFAVSFRMLSQATGWLGAFEKTR